MQGKEDQPSSIQSAEKETNVTLNADPSRPVTEAEAESMSVNHPEFRYVSHWSALGFPVVVFDRRIFFEPTAAQCEDYRRRRAIVEANGGYMRQQEYELGGETPLYTEDDCAMMKKAVEAALPEWEIKDTWNGTGCRTYSIAIQRTSAVSGDNNQTQE